MKTQFLLYIILIISIFTSFKIVESQDYQRIAHLGYFHAERDSTDYHYFEIMWFKGDLPGSTAPVFSSTPKFYTIRGQTPSEYPPSSETDIKLKLNRRYSEYVMEINGIHLTKHYVAWDILTYDNCSANNNKKVVFKAKFFNKSWDALKFYQSLVAETEKIRFNLSGVVEALKLIKNLSSGVVEPSPSTISNFFSKTPTTVCP